VIIFPLPCDVAAYVLAIILDKAKRVWLIRELAIDTIDGGIKILAKKYADDTNFVA
jgi:hypothetical protein